jgi:hypothetical protein
MMQNITLTIAGLLKPMRLPLTPVIYSLVLGVTWVTAFFLVFLTSLLISFGFGNLKLTHLE